MAQVHDLIEPRPEEVALARLSPLSGAHRSPHRNPDQSMESRSALRSICKESRPQPTQSGKPEYFPHRKSPTSSELGHSSRRTSECRRPRGAPDPNRSGMCPTRSRQCEGDSLWLWREVSSDVHAAQSASARHTSPLIPDAVRLGGSCEQSQRCTQVCRLKFRRHFIPPRLLMDWQSLLCHRWGRLQGRLPQGRVYKDRREFIK